MFSALCSYYNIVIIIAIKDAGLQFGIKKHLGWNNANFCEGINQDKRLHT